MRYITGSKLKGDIFEYRRLKNKMSSPEKYTRSEKIFSEATELLDDYAVGKIGVRAKDNKVMAQYIDTFAVANQEKLLDKLQKASTFDVKEYLEDSKRTYWQRLFHINPRKNPRLTADMMKSRIKDYDKLNKELASGWFHKEKLYDKQYRLEKEAVGYAVAFVENKFTVARDEVSTLKQYFNAFSNQNSEKDMSAALNKIEQTTLEEFPESQPSRWQRFKAAAKNKWQDVKEKFSHKATVITLNNRRGLMKAAAVVAFFALVGAAIKSDSLAKSPKKSNTEQKAPAKAPSQDVSTKTDAFVAPAAEKAQLTPEQKIWQNFYDTKNQLQANDMGVDLQQLYNKVSEQQSKGIFQMPENISVERFAYTHLIYKAYGMVSPLEQALNGDKALSAAQQKQISEAINIAGENGYGVKRLAQSIAAKHGRKLGNHSAFRDASKKMQTQYVSNLKQVRDLKQKQI